MLVVAADSIIQNTTATKCTAVAVKSIIKGHKHVTFQDCHLFENRRKVVMTAAGYGLHEVNN
jgi:hypothetical protein